jgi:hypothetical protein
LSTLRLALFPGLSVRLLSCPKLPSFRSPSFFLLSALQSLTLGLLMLLARDYGSSTLSICPAGGLDCLACSSSLIPYAVPCAVLLRRLIRRRFRSTPCRLLLASSRRCS